MFGAPGPHVDIQTPGAPVISPPGRCQHGAGVLLLHQDETHAALARRLHQLDRFAAGMADDERRSGLLEGLGHEFDGGRHLRGFVTRLDGCFRPSPFGRLSVAELGYFAWLPQGFGWV
jgi:hypothetical protein